MTRKRRSTGQEPDQTVASDTPLEATPPEEAEGPPAEEQVTNQDGDEPVSREEESATEGPADNQEHIPPHQSSSGNRQLFFILLALLLLGGSLFYLWQQQQGLRSQLQASQSRVSQLQQLLDQRYREQQALRNEIPTHTHDDLQRQTRENNELLASQQGRLYQLEQQMGQGRRVWGVAEAEYLLQTALQRLELEHDPGTAAVALRMARERLKEIDESTFALVIRKIDENLQQLTDTSVPDRSAMAAQLSSLSAAVETLPLSHTAIDTEPRQSSPTTEEPATAQSGWRGIWNRLWRDIRSLVTIRHEGEIERPTLAPEERYFLRHNLQLKLDSARLALLADNPQAWRAILAEAGEWLVRYYDTEAPAVQQALASLEQLGAVELSPAMPDLGAPLKLLQQTPLPSPNLVSPEGSSEATSNSDEMAAEETPVPAAESEAEQEPQAAADHAAAVGAQGAPAPEAQTTNTDQGEAANDTAAPQPAAAPQAKTGDTQ